MRCWVVRVDSLLIPGRGLDAATLPRFAAAVEAALRERLARGAIDAAPREIGVLGIDGPASGPDGAGAKVGAAIHAALTGEGSAWRVR
jgi:hypothetical protein